MGWKLLLVFTLFGLCRAETKLTCDNATRHEVSACIWGCPPERTCQNLHGPEPPCVPPTGPCKPQCVCADGYARNLYGGTCVTFEQCDKCPGNNQYFACHCTPGYERDANNVCVSTAPPPVDDHPSPPPVPSSQPIRKPDFPPKPVLTCDNVTLHLIPACTWGCPPERTCQNRKWPLIPCAYPRFPCTPKCICDHGYARNQPDGTCITLDQCDKCPGENEYFACDGDYAEDCVGHCYCFSDHVRDIDDKCVYVDPASPPGILDPPTEPQEPELTCNATLHEVPGCTWGCPPERTCQNRKWPLPPCAPPSFPCTPKCICAEGYTRNQPDGTCVTEEQCDKCPGENEYFACDGDYSEGCIGHCYCFSDHVRDIDGKCVYVDPASPPGILDPPTEPEDPPLTCDNVTLHLIPACTWGCPPERTCQNRNWPPLPCARPIFPCTQKCICDHGYARNKPDGTCITLEQCDKCPGENEYFACDGDYAEDCVGHCYCFSDHVRDIDGKCVYVDPASPPGILDPPTEPQEPELNCNATLHEVPGCTRSCPPERTCQNRNWLPPPCAPPGFPCTPKCICDDGYTRNQPDGTCVTEEQCDQCPGENEYFACDGDYAEDCVGHCYCFSDHVRDIDDKCVYVDPASPPGILDPPTESKEPELTCNATLHEVPGCTWGCPPERTCQNRNWPPFPCAHPSFPCTPKCLCADGYTRSQPDGTCITEEQCDFCPGENEYFRCDVAYAEDCAGKCCCFSNHVRDIDDKCVYVNPASPPGILVPPNNP